MRIKVKMKETLMVIKSNQVFVNAYDDVCAVIDDNHYIIISTRQPERILGELCNTGFYNAEGHTASLHCGNALKFLQHLM